MKKKILTKIAMIISVIIIANISICFAKTNEYTINEEYSFEVSEDMPTMAYIKIYVGNMNITDYSNGTISVYPSPSKIIEDSYGNQYVKFAYTMLEPSKGGNFNVSIKKKVQTNDKVAATKEFLGMDSKRRYLSAVPRIESNNAYIIQTANDLIEGCTTDEEKVVKIFEFVNMYLTYDTSDIYRNKGAMAAMLNGRGVCEEYATLFCAMCRAVDIPARVITGYNTENLIMTEKTEIGDSYHAWPEVYLKDKGWVPLEITAEFYEGGQKKVYKDGILKLPDPTVYISEGIYNPIEVDEFDNNKEKEYNAIEWLGVTLLDYNKYITLTNEIYFDDIDSHWAQNSIQNLYNKKIINGYEDNTFLPNNNVTIAEYITMLSRLVKCLQLQYLDVQDIYYPQDFEDNWLKESYDNLIKYYAFYAQDMENGAGYNTITNVFGDVLDMNKPILREEAVALLSPFLRYVENEETPLLDVEDSKFKQDIIKAYENNVILGYEDNTFKPKNTITRAEIATIFDRLTSKEK